MDLSDDLFAQPVKAARPGGRFQPKSKLKPPTKKAPPTANLNTDSAPVQVTESVKNADSSFNNDSTSASLAREKYITKDIIDKANASSHPNLEMVREEHAKSAGQNADTFMCSESIDDLVPQSTTTDMGESVPWSDAVSFNIPIPENTGGSGLPIIFYSTYTNTVIEDPTYVQVLDEGDPITESSCDGGVSMFDKECEKMSVMGSIANSDLTIRPVQRTGKFQPKRKIQMQKEIPLISSMESDPNPPEINSCEKDSFPDFIGDDFDDNIDLSPIGPNDGAQGEKTSEPLLNEESMNLMEDVRGIPAKLGSRRAKVGMSEARVASNDSGQHQNASSSGQDNEITDRVLRPRKKKVGFCKPDEAEDIQVREISDKNPASSAEDEGDNCDDEQFEHESESKVEKKRRKSTKPNEDKEKQSKRQKAKKASDVKPKKFSHSTRRRQVDKTLLLKEANEEEIDYTNVPLKELIRLAEHKEKQTIKEEATAQPAMKQSNGNSASYHEKETYASREDEEDNDEQEPEAEVQDMNYFNYHTFMNKAPTIRWSKQDTELFYGAVLQFGTDLSMIQHLFPGRSRHQIKLKYKKEERQNPFRLHDALTTRTKDVSHFQKVIDRLKQIAAEEKQDDEEEDEDESMGNEVEEEETSLVNNEEAKTEETDKEEREDVPEDVIEKQGSEDEDDPWNDYKSNM